MKLLLTISHTEDSLITLQECLYDLCAIMFVGFHLSACKEFIFTASSCSLDYHLLRIGFLIVSLEYLAT